MVQEMSGYIYYSRGSIRTRYFRNSVIWHHFGTPGRTMVTFPEMLIRTQADRDKLAKILKELRRNGIGRKDFWTLPAKYRGR